MLNGAKDLFCDQYVDQPFYISELAYLPFELKVSILLLNSGVMSVFNFFFRVTDFSTKNRDIW